MLKRIGFIVALALLLSLVVSSPSRRALAATPLKVEGEITGAFIQVNQKPPASSSNVNAHRPCPTGCFTPYSGPLDEAWKLVENMKKKWFWNPVWEKAILEAAYLKETGLNPSSLRPRGLAGSFLYTILGPNSQGKIDDSTHLVQGDATYISTDPKTGMVYKAYPDNHIVFTDKNGKVITQFDLTVNSFDEPLTDFTNPDGSHFRESAEEYTSVISADGRNCILSDGEEDFKLVLDPKTDEFDYTDPSGEKYTLAETKNGGFITKDAQGDEIVVAGDMSYKELDSSGKEVDSGKFKEPTTQERSAELGYPINPTSEDDFKKRESVWDSSSVYSNESATPAATSQPENNPGNSTEPAATPEATSQPENNSGGAPEPAATPEATSQPENQSAA